MNANLSIAIPTYNRSQFLDYSLSINIPIARKFDVPIYVSDNNSSDDTFEVVQRWMKTYDYLFYSKNEKNLGPDVNFELSLKLPETQYVWLLGDTSKISNKIFETILLQVKEKYDLIILNEAKRVKDIKSQIINDKDFLLSKLGWHLTQIACVIFSKELINNTNFYNYRDTRFIHVGVIFEFLSSKETFLAKWNQELSTEMLKIENVPKISWQEDTLDIWLRKWPNFVFSLPASYSLAGKKQTILTHNNKTNIFGFKSLMFLRSEGFYSFNHLLSYKKFFKVALGRVFILEFLLVACLPSSFVRFLIKFYFRFAKSFNFQESR
jgi:glycosyltransferase involved in cell wall biosynthesis